ncbi:FecCD family ABC transporter permease [Roseobacter sp. CCS2]|uniref:FecCD family ABC transporter permease n=1 Tax=Roseobacter sp. CCS2 TaxID=391593 RepID=UPI0000F402B9|nr:iron ABC transporter permease [Roseobacter sp. CCS2]EBA13655.1 transport system permease protein [Roseobacter sp. CCS2]
MTRITWLGMPVILTMMVFAFGWHIAVGAKTVPLADVFTALTSYDRTNFDHVVVVDLRLPRAVYAVLVGASLSVAGALMQGITRNPLAEPGILGLLTGASFVVVLAVGFFRVVDPVWIPLLAAIGATATAALVWGIAAAAPGGSTPLTLVLAGAAITAFLGAFIALANLLDQESFEAMRVWLTGTLAGRSTDVLLWSLPWMIGGLALAFGLARQVTALAMGDDTAVGLGVNVAKIKALAMLAVIALTAASVAIAGPMGFVGLVIPHVARLIVGADYRLIVPFSAALGAVYLLLVDIAARMVLAPVEISTGLVTALLGAPFFVWLVRARL